MDARYVKASAAAIAEMILETQIEYIESDSDSETVVRQVAFRLGQLNEMASALEEEAKKEMKNEGTGRNEMD